MSIRVVPDNLKALSWIVTKPYGQGEIVDWNASREKLIEMGFSKSRAKETVQYFRAAYYTRRGTYPSQRKGLDELEERKRNNA